MSNWIDCASAVARLGVKAQTLYAYVSRGRVAVRPDPADPRRSLYNAGDIEGLKVRRARGRARSAVASSAMAWGEPSLETAISTVDHDRLIYRGIDAVAFAAAAGWEETAQLLWQSDGPVLLPASEEWASGPFAALAALIPASYPALGRNEDRLRTDAAAAIACLAASFGSGPGSNPLHVRLLNGWAIDRSLGEPLRRALVLLADHELNASTFAVRVAASTGASMAASLMAGLCALSGPLHGGAGAQAIGLIDEAERRGPSAAVRQYLCAGRHLPGFGHPLYPAGDPRAVALLEILAPDELASGLRAEAAEICGLHPNIDFALAVLTRSGALPRDAPFRLFALGRSIGWTAHVIEQVTEGRPIRPRATYVGPRPDEPPR
ncbi:MAG TPA: citrate synthase [Sphingomicrobium sp.]|nr:citrate synthase [Sphingomicrobium sp.]